MNESGDPQSTEYIADKMQEPPIPLTPTQAGENVDPSDTSSGGTIEQQHANPKSWSQQFQEMGVDRLIELALTLGIVFFAGCQLYITWANSKSSTRQITKIIKSAERINRAAESFSRSSSLISGSMDAAVGKLNLQASQLAESAKETSKLAKETNMLAMQAQRSADYAKQSINTAVDAERPWVGVSTYRVDNFVEGKTATINIQYINSGKRPATVSMLYGGAPLDKLPLFPDLVGNQARSVGFMLPGATNAGTFTYDIPEGAFAKWKAAHQVFFIVAEILYTDVGTNTAHITDFCAYYDPTKKDIPFPLCTRMNDAK